MQVYGSLRCPVVLIMTHKSIFPVFKVSWIFFWMSSGWLHHSSGHSSGHRTPDGRCITPEMSIFHSDTMKRESWPRG